MEARKIQRGRGQTRRKASRGKREARNGVEKEEPSHIYDSKQTKKESVTTEYNGKDRV